MSGISKKLSECFKGCWSIMTKARNINSSKTLISLHNGEKVSVAALKTTLFALDAIKSHRCRDALEIDLFKKALDHSYNFPPILECDSRLELRKLQLLESDNKMHDEIAAILRNCFGKESFRVCGLNPFTGVALKRDFSWKRLIQDFSDTKH